MEAWVGTAFVIVIAIVSRVFYLDNKQASERFADQPAIPCQQSFKWAYAYIKVVTLVVAPLCFFFDHPLLLEWHHSTPLFYMGMSLAGLGMSAFIMAKLTLGHHYNPCFEAYLPKDIVQEGLYKYIRHPIYTANLLIMAGASLATGSWWILSNLVLLAVYYYRASHLEETALAKEFPQYKDYQMQTGAFLPRISGLADNNWGQANKYEEQLQYRWSYPPKKRQDQLPETSLDGRHKDVKSLRKN